jgi:hypothetical protein
LITVDGEPIALSSDADDGGQENEGLRLARLDLKLCKALLALDPPHELSVLLHARIAEQLRRLSSRYYAVDQDVRQVADLTSEELREAAGVIRAIRALPSLTKRGFPGTLPFRSALGGYALDIVDEIDQRPRDNS